MSEHLSLAVWGVGEWKFSEMGQKAGRPRGGMGSWQDEEGMSWHPENIRWTDIAKYMRSQRLGRVTDTNVQVDIEDEFAAWAKQHDAADNWDLPEDAFAQWWKDIGKRDYADDVKAIKIDSYLSTRIMKFLYTYPGQKITSQELASEFNVSPAALEVVLLALESSGQIRQTGYDSRGDAVWGVKSIKASVIADIAEALSHNLPPNQLASNYTRRELQEMAQNLEWRSHSMGSQGSNDEYDWNQAERGQWEDKIALALRIASGKSLPDLIARELREMKMGVMDDDMAKDIIAIKQSAKEIQKIGAQLKAAMAKLKNSVKDKRTFADIMAGYEGQGNDPSDDVIDFADMALSVAEMLEDQDY
jgi:hypothetical protein